MRASSPRVDEMYRDIIAVPPSVLAWLRQHEERVLRMCEALEAPVTEPVKGLREVREEYRLLLEGRHSLFQRTLRLPVRQLRPESPARARLDQLIADLEERARIALKVQAEVEALRARLQDLEQFSAHLPHLSANILRVNRLGADQIDRMRRPAEVRAAMDRVIHVAAELETLLSGQEAETGDTNNEGELDSELTRHELRALKRAAIGKRQLIRRDFAASNALRQTFGQQLRDLHTVQAPATAEVDTESLVLSQILRRSAQSEAAGMPSDQVAGLVALGRGKGGLGAVAVSPPSTTPTPVAENTLFVVPIDQGFVYISREAVSGVRVWSAGIRPDTVIEASPVPVFEDGLDRGAVECDLKPLFDGLLDGPTAWYKPARRLRIRVLGKDGTGWYGKVERRGGLEPVAGNPWSSRHTDTTAFRMWGTDNTLYTQDSPLQASRGGVLWELLDVRAEVARIPIPGFERTIRKVPASRAKELEANIEAERRLFAALAHRSEARLLPYALVPVGSALVEGNLSARPVYLMPDALTRQECPPIEAWLRSSLPLRMAALREIARVVVATHQVGYSLGVLHLDCFAFGVAEAAQDGSAKPGAVLVAAPWAVPLGTPFQAGSRAEEGVKYDHLSLRYAPNAVRFSQSARQEDDATAFALLMLDLLVRDIRAGAWLTWTSPGDPISGLSTTFILSPLAKSIIKAINIGREGAMRLLRVVELLAARDPLRQEDLIAVLGD